MFALRRFGGDMTRRNLAILFAAALTILYSYEILTAVLNDTSTSGLHLLGLVCALGFLIIELRPTLKTDDCYWPAPAAQTFRG
jgi:hypothetical protein